MILHVIKWDIRPEVMDTCGESPLAPAPIKPGV
jgi:hypothetical protein